MASSPEAAALTETHRLAQARIGAETVSLLRTAWGLLDFDALDATTEAWLGVTESIVARQARKSAKLSADYYRHFRNLEVPDAVPFSPDVVLPDSSAVRTSLLVEGPVAFKARVGRGLSFDVARRMAEAGSAGAGMRHALNGGRDTLGESVRTDPVALGWVRVTGPNPCGFCAMLSSRGPEFKAGSFGRSDAQFTGSGTAKVHDSCGCSFEPVLRERSAWPASAQRWRDLWAEVEQDQIEAWRETGSYGRSAAKRFRSKVESGR